jgi:glycosyltransferase involved in cell wall biosynthesis
MINSKIAVIIPCYNEGPAIGNVVSAIRQALPTSIIYVYDNNSTDDTVMQAKESGAIVRYETYQGKGHVIRRAFANIEADIYVMVDGDGTYDVAVANKMVELLLEEDLDMVVGSRAAQQDSEAYRRGHRFGNKFLTKTIALLFEQHFKDVLSGYRVFSKRFVKSFPVLASGFEIEVMFTVHALQLRMPTQEFETNYFKRMAGTSSKLSTFKDGIKIFFTILLLFKDVRPFTFFGLLTLLFATTSTALGIPIVV